MRGSRRICDEFKSAFGLEREKGTYSLVIRIDKNDFIVLVDTILVNPV
jgi:hypothetical protein